MFRISKLFGKSPFSSLLTHMGLVDECVGNLNPLLSALKNGEYEKVQEIAKKISKTEHEADKTKNEIRNHLPKTLFLPIDRSHILEILALQDSIADQAEDVAVLLNLKELSFPAPFNSLFSEFLQKNLESFAGVKSIMKEFHDLLESSFGGVEAERVRNVIHEIAHKEHQVDLLQRELLKRLIADEDNMSYTTFFLWHKVIEAIASISNLSEKLANRIRMILDLK